MPLWVGGGGVNVFMSAKPCVLLLHGLLCDARVWQQQSVVLAEDFDVRIPLLRGPASFAAMATMILAQAPARFHLVGHSMGARVALEILRQAGPRVDGLILMSFGTHPVAADEPARYQAMQTLAETQGMSALAEHWAGIMVPGQGKAAGALRDLIRQMAAQYCLADFQSQVQAALARQDQSQVLASHSGAVLLLCGEEDQWSPPSQHRQILADTADASLEVVSGAGHMLPLQRPTEVSGRISSWLQQGTVQRRARSAGSPQAG